MPSVSAIYVSTEGPYPDLVSDIWDEVRDARYYAGPNPVVAHPPCQRWGRYWFGGPSVRVRKKKGADGGCFAMALDAVREFGGVLEHPAASHAWAAFGLARPPASGGWVQADEFGGWTCHVEQGHYGHLARKATWLYACKADLPELRWGPSAAARLDEGFHSAAERRAARGAGVLPIERMGKLERCLTPLEFAVLLVQIATSVRSRSRKAASPRR